MDNYSKPSLLHILMLIWGVLEILLYAGQVFGWPSLEYVFQRDGYFADACAVNLSAPINSSILESCKEWNFYYQQIFTLASVITGSILLFAGIFFDRFGSRTTRLFPLIGVSASSLAIAFSTPEYSMILYPAVIVLAVTSYMVLLTNMQLANLVPAYKSTIISLCTGAFDSSAFIFVIVKLGYTSGVSLKISFITLCVVFLILFIPSTFIFLPKERIPFPPPENYMSDECKKVAKVFRCRVSEQKPLKEATESGIKIIVTDVDNQDHEHYLDISGIATPMTFGSMDVLPTSKTLAHKTLHEAVHNLKLSDDMSYFDCVKCPIFISDLIWITIHRMRNWFFLGVFRVWLTSMVGNDDEFISNFTTIFATMQLLGIFIAPFSGRLMDQKVNEKNPQVAKIKACIPSFVLDTTVGTVLSIVACIPYTNIQYITCALHVFHRAFLYGPNSAFVAKVFPAKHFGKLFGTFMTVSALLSLLQFGLFVIVKGPLNGDPFYVHIILCIVVILSYGHPLYLWKYCNDLRKASAESEPALENGETECV